MIEFKIYTTVKDLPIIEWNGLTRHDIFLQTHYLEAFEKACPNTICAYYVGVFNRKELVGVAVIQRVQLYLKDMFRHEGATRFKEALQNILSKFLKGNILVVGNLTHTGQHGIFVDQTKISQTQFIEKIFEACDELSKWIRINRKRKIRLILFKDYFKNDSIHLEQSFFEFKKFYKMQVQPNMIMKPRKNWLSTQDYVADMTTKYRSRFNRARQKNQSIITKELNLEEIKAHTIDLYKLYKNVSKNASFNTFILPKNHFLILKEYLLSDFKVFGYYLNNELIGFYTLILNNKSLETYFLGYDSEHQHSNQLYLNMLYDMAGYAINNQFESVVYARTAMEIKSSVGAQPEPMFIYLKYTNSFVNALLKQIFNLMNPTQKWEERRPFKK
ncbi:MAG TPA: GNAT family N-acetyltransferase [Yeosuana sp.]